MQNTQTISGTFNNEGEIVSGYAPKDTRVYLSTFLFPKKQFDTYHTISIRPISNKAIEIIARRNGIPVARRTLNHGQNYTYKNNWLYLKREHEFMTGGNATLCYATGRDKITMSEDNYLIVKSSGFGTGLFCILPFVSGGHNWLRFEKVSF